MRLAEERFFGHVIQDWGASLVGNYLARLKTEYKDRVRKLKDTGAGEDQNEDARLAKGR